MSIKALSKEEKKAIKDKYSVKLTLEESLDLIYEYEDRRYDPVTRTWFSRLNKKEQKLKKKQEE